jgi:hypothetical protein
MDGPRDARTLRAVAAFNRELEAGATEGCALNAYFRAQRATDALVLAWDNAQSGLEGLPPSDASGRVLVPQASHAVGHAPMQTPPMLGTSQAPLRADQVNLLGNTTGDPRGATAATAPPQAPSAAAGLVSQLAGRSAPTVNGNTPAHQVRPNPRPNPPPKDLRGPAKFLGEDSNEDAESFLWQLQKYLAVAYPGHRHNWSIIAMQFLGGVASRHYTAQVMHYERAAQDRGLPTPHYTWEMFCSSLNTAFPQVNQSYNDLEDFMSIRQGGNSLQDYASEFTRAANLCSDLSEPLRIYQFLKGMEPYAHRVMGIDPYTSAPWESLTKLTKAAIAREQTGVLTRTPHGAPSQGKRHQSEHPSHFHSLSECDNADSPSERDDDSPSERGDDESPSEHDDDLPSERDDDSPSERGDDESPSEREYESPSERGDDSPSERDDGESPSERDEYESPSDRGDDSPSERGDDESPSELEYESPSEHEYDEPLSDRDDENLDLAAMNAQKPKRRRGGRGRAHKLKQLRSHQTEDPLEDPHVKRVTFQM